MAAGPDELEMYEALNRAIVQNADGRVRTLLEELRQAVGDSFYAGERERLLGALAASEEDGWNAWRHAFLRSLDTWPDELGLRLYKDDWPVTGERAQELGEIVAAADLIDQMRWAEALPVLERLSDDDEIPPALRAVALEYRAMIWLHVLLRPAEARRLLEQLDRLGSASTRVHCAWTEYHVAEHRGASGETAEWHADEAKAAAQRALDADPTTGRALVSLSELARAQGDVRGADALLRQALATGDEDACRELVSARLEDGADLADVAVQQLVELWRLLAPGRSWSVSVLLGETLAGQRLHDAAIEANAEAIALQPAWPKAYVNLGYALLDRGEPEEARQRFGRAAELAPDFFDAWDALAWEREQASDWPAALEHLELALRNRPMWEPELRERRATCFMRLERLDDAEREALAALRADPGNITGYAAAQDFAQFAYQEHGDDDRALRVFAAIREARGTSEEGQYRNAIGNLHFYRSRYDEATEQFERAVDSDPEDAVMWFNLGLSWKHRAWGSETERALNEAAQALRTSRRLAPDDDDTERVLHTVELQLRILRACGSGALMRVPVATPIVIGIAEGLVERILEPGTLDLSAGFAERIELMRTDLEERTGIRFPGLRFTYAREDLEGDRALEIMLFEVPVAVAHVSRSAEDVGSALLEEVARVLEANTRAFVSHEDAASALAVTSREITGDEDELVTRVVRAAQARAAAGERISWSELAAAHAATESDQEGVSVAEFAS
jgi:tetratricopeptide (TPR) repeat protein